MEKYVFKKISEVDHNKLMNFYRSVFKERNEKLIQNFNWIYGISISKTKFEPILVESNNEIVAHAGLTPAKIEIDFKVHDAIWFTDLIVVPKYRNLGVGKKIVQEWMKMAAIQITLCNDASLGIFKDLGWKCNNLKENCITPISLRSLIPGIKQFSSTRDDKKIFNNLDNFEILELNETNIDKIISLESKKKNYLQINRDQKFFFWRTLNCPLKKEIIIFKTSDDFLICRLFNKKNLKRLNLLFQSNHKNQRTFALLKQWAKKNRVDYIWSIKNEDETKSLLSIRKKINFAYFSKDKEILDILENKKFFLQGIDSDIDFI